MPSPHKVSKFFYKYLDFLTIISKKKKERKKEKKKKLTSTSGTGILRPVLVLVN